MNTLTDNSRLAGMVAGCPWGSPLSSWTVGQLRRGIDECDAAGGESPVLGAALAKEFAARRAAE